MLRLTGAVPTFTSIRADTPAHMLADIDSVAQQQKWPTTVYLTGHEYLLVSPQGFRLKLRFWIDSATHPGYVLAQAISYYTAEVSNLFLVAADYAVGGPRHARTPTASFWANVCSCFMSEPGQGTYDLLGRLHLWIDTSFSAGVPYCPLSVHEIWWAASDHGQTVNGAGADWTAHFRFQSYSHYFSVKYDTDALRNYPPISLTPFPNRAGVLQLGLRRPAVPVTTRFVDGLLWLGGSPMADEPLLIWAKDDTSPGKIRGSIYDACLLSRPLPEGLPGGDPSVTILENVFVQPPRTTKWANYLVPVANTFADDATTSALLLLTAISTPPPPPPPRAPFLYPQYITDLSQPVNA